MNTQTNIVIKSEYQLIANRYVLAILNDIYKELRVNTPSLEYFKFEKGDDGLLKDVPAAKIVNFVTAVNNTAEKFKEINAEDNLLKLRQQDENLGRFIGADFTDWFEMLVKYVNADKNAWLICELTGHFYDTIEIVIAFINAIEFAIKKIKRELLPAE